ncbi:MAG: hypothetical protein NE330_14220 [Lentisphaeraceae bacterium]|nr:hypothetical protein [Lentisphaeraceae bacterium]
MKLLTILVSLSLLSVTTFAEEKKAEPVKKEVKKETPKAKEAPTKNEEASKETPKKKETKKKKMK